MNKTVTVIIPVYEFNPRIAKCLECVKPQVDDVILVCGTAVSPVFFGDKVKELTIGDNEIGYGRKINFAAQHTDSEFLLLLNDDVFLNPDVVSHLLAEIKKQDDYAAVSHTLRFPEGHIQYGGCFRGRGEIGFSHMDYRRSRSRYSQPVEQECFCAASVLIRHTAFDRVLGFDETYRLYSEDTDLSMKLRKDGWRLIFTPVVEGIHIGQATAKTLDNWRGIRMDSLNHFERKWGWYFRKNPQPFCLGKF